MEDIKRKRVINPDVISNLSRGLRQNVSPETQIKPEPILQPEYEYAKTTFWSDFKGFCEEMAEVFVVVTKAVVATTAFVVAVAALNKAFRKKKCRNSRVKSGKKSLKKQPRYNINIGTLVLVS